MGSIPGSGRSTGGGHGNPLQDSCLENPMDRGAWRATVHRVAQSWTRLKRLSMHRRRGGTCTYLWHSLGKNLRSVSVCWRLLSSADQAGGNSKPLKISVSPRGCRQTHQDLSTSHSFISPKPLSPTAWGSFQPYTSPKPPFHMPSLFWTVYLILFLTERKENWNLSARTVSALSAYSHDTVTPSSSQRTALSPRAPTSSFSLYPVLDKGDRRA